MRHVPPSLNTWPNTGLPSSEPYLSYHVLGWVNGQEIRFMLNTGVAVSLKPWTGLGLVGIEGSPIQPR